MCWNHTYLSTNIASAQLRLCAYYESRLKRNCLRTAAVHAYDWHIKQRSIDVE